MTTNAADENRSTSGRGHLAAVEAELARAVAPGPGAQPSAVLDVAAAHLSLGGGGKRTRARFIGLLGRALDVHAGDLVACAVTAELVHAASILHDDVIDDGRTRRGRPTVNVQWGNGVAVLAGDWLLTRAFEALFSCPAEVSRDAVRTVSRMTRAAIRELELRRTPDLSPGCWQDVAAGKTGALFAWCAAAVARLGRVRELELWRNAGRQLGVTFQAVDDMRDLFDDGKGKDRFADVRNRNPSFALAFAAQHDPAVRTALQRAWAKPSTSRAEAARLGRTILASHAVAPLCAAVNDEIARTLAVVHPLLAVEAEQDHVVELLFGRMAWRQ